MRDDTHGHSDGYAAIEPADEVTAGDFGEWTIRFVAGSAGLPAGAVVRFEIPFGFTPPQLLWPDDVGYAEAACSRRDVVLEASSTCPGGQDAPPGEIARGGRMVYVRLASGALRPGDTIWLHYGLRQLPTPGAQAPQFAHRANFTVATDAEGAGQYVPVAAEPTLMVVGRPPAGLEVVAPSTVEIDEELRVRVRAVDAHDNLSPIQPADFHLMTGLEEGGFVPLLDHTAGKSFQTSLEVPGERQFAVACEGIDLVGVSNPCLCSENALEHRLFWGDLHAATGLSDGMGTPDECHAFARDEAALDFCALTDHAACLTADAWAALQESVAAFHEDGSFVPLLGYDYAGQQLSGEGSGACIYYPGASGPLLWDADAGRSADAGLARHAAEWKSHGAMMCLHQPPGLPGFYDPDLVRLIQVYSSWGASESEYTSRSLFGADQERRQGPWAADVLQKGWVLGLTGASADHSGRPGWGDWLRTRHGYEPGLVGVWATGLSRREIWEALWNRRCYATTGPRMVVEMRVDGEPMGSIIEGSAFSATHVIEVRVLGTDPIVAVEVLRGTQHAYVHSSYTPSVHFTFRDTPPPGSARYYYLRITQGDGAMAWTSPVWIV